MRPVRPFPRFRLAALVACAAVLAGACSPGAPAGDGSVTVVVLDGDREALRIRAEVAATPGQRAPGLMGREEVEGGVGMLFLFPEERTLSFWMKGTLVPLDLAFIRGNRIVEIVALEPCRAEPCPTTRSSEPASRALEVRAGTFAAAGIGPGAAVAIEGDLPQPR